MTSPFCKTQPKLQYAWDSVSLGELLFCPRRYQYTIVEGYTPSTQNVYLTFGIAYHSTLERYNKVLTETGDKVKARREALRLAMILSLPHAQDWSEAKVRRPVRNRFTFIRTICWYMEHYSNDNMQTIMLDQGPATELSFRLPLPFTNPDGDPYLLCGHLDNLVLFNDEPAVREFKHTHQTLGSNYFDTYSPNHQIRIYKLASKIIYKVEVGQVIIDAAQVAINFSRFDRREIDVDDSELDEFLQGLQARIKEAEMYAEADFWPMNESQCWHCPFHEVCKKRPASRQPYLDADFIHKGWNPLESR